jgi:hypothetical protein
VTKFKKSIEPRSSSPGGRRHYDHWPMCMMGQRVRDTSQQQLCEPLSTPATNDDEIRVFSRRDLVERRGRRPVDDLGPMLDTFSS